MYKLKNQSLIILGSLNPAIITPNWIAQCGLIPLEKEVKFKFPIGAVIAPIHYEYDEFKWELDYSRLKVEINDKEELLDLGETISKVFEKLEYTPIKSMGHNFEFKLEDQSIYKKITGSFNFALGQKLDGLGQVTKLKNDIALKQDDKIINISIVNEGETPVARFNFHYDLSSHAELIEKCDKYKENFNQAKEVLSFLLNP